MITAEKPVGVEGIDYDRIERYRDGKLVKVEYRVLGPEEKALRLRFRRFQELKAKIKGRRANLDEVQELLDLLLEHLGVG